MDPNAATTPPTQTQAAAQDAKDPAAPERVLKVHGKTWPLIEKMSLFSTANLQKALNEGDLLGIVDGLARMTPTKHRDEIRDYLLTDREPNNPEFIDDEVLLDAFRGAQEAFRS